MPPFRPDAESLLQPCPERNRLDNRRRHDFFTRERPPRHRVDRLFVVGREVAGVVTRKVRHIRQFIELGLQLLPIGRREEELDKWLRGVSSDSNSHARGRVITFWKT